MNGSSGAGSIGEAVRDARIQHGLSTSELANRIRDLAANDKDIETVDRTSLSRIESGSTRNPRETTLRAIALALGESPSYFMNRAQRDATLSIGASHGIFSAPAIIAALTLTIEGARFTTFGSGEADGPFEPRWSNLSPNGKRTLYRPQPSVVVPFAGRDGKNAGLIEWKPADDVEGAESTDANSIPALRTATAAKIIDLWARNEIDVAIISADMFNQQRSALDEAVHCCTLTHNSGRGISLIALYDDKKITNIEEIFPRNIIRAVSSRQYGDAKIIVPKNTFATEQVKEIGRSTPGRIEPYEVPIGDYGKFRDIVFNEVDNQANNGLVIAAIWEPFVAFIREDWKDRLRARGDDVPTVLKEPLTGWRDCSLTKTVDSTGAVGLPTVTMDVLVRKKYLDDSGGVPFELDQFLSRLKHVTSELGESSRSYRKLNALAITLTDRDIESESYRGLSSDIIKELASYYGISELDCIRSIAEIGFEIGYTPEYVEYLKKLLPRRAFATRDGSRI